MPIDDQVIVSFLLGFASGAFVGIFSLVVTTTIERKEKKEGK